MDSRHGIADILPAGRFVGHTARERVLPRVRLVETSYAGGQVIPRHAHERAHLCFVVDGIYTESLATYTTRREALSVMYLPGGAVHEERHHVPGRHFLVELLGSPAELYGDGAEPRLPTQLDGEGPLLAARLYAAFRSEGALAATTADAAWELLALAAPVRPRDHPRWLARTRDSIRDRYRATLRLETLAAEASVHPVHLAQMFRRVFGSTVGQFVRRLRLEHACAALLAGRRSLSEIAQDAGFADQSHLTRTFRATMGMTPGRYRALAGSASPKRIQDAN